MRFKRNDTYFTIAVYVVGTMVTILLIGIILFYFKTLWGYLVDLLKMSIQIIKPLLIGLIIAYLFDPIVERYDVKCARIKTRWDKSKQEKRTFATTLTFITIMALVGLIVLIISINISDLIGSLDDKGIQSSVAHYVELFKQTSENMSEIASRTPFINKYREIITEIYIQSNNFIISVIDRTIDLFKIFWINIIPVILGIVIAFYALNDKNKLLKVIDNIMGKLFSCRVHQELKDITKAVDEVFTGYIRGQILDAIIIGILISVVLTVIGIKFAVIIGIISGIFNIIPYFGPIIGVVLAGTIGLIDGEPLKAIYAIIAVIILQQIDGWFIVPKIMGETVKLHPIAIILAIIIAGELFGFVGFLVAVPITGFIRIMIIRYVGDLFKT